MNWIQNILGKDIASLFLDPLDQSLQTLTPRYDLHLHFRCGNLKARLQDLLQARIAEELPEVFDDIKSKLVQAEEELEAMGPCLETSEERRRAFDGIVKKTVDLVEKSSLQYDHDDFFSTESGDGSRNPFFMAEAFKELQKLRETVYALGRLEDKEASRGLVEGQQYATKEDDKYVKFTYKESETKPSIIKPDFFA
jgi:hypothetical protein